MIKRLRASWRALRRLMGPLGRAPLPILAVGVALGAWIMSMIKDTFMIFVGGIMVGLCLAIAAMVAVWAHQDQTKSTRK